MRNPIQVVRVEHPFDGKGFWQSKDTDGDNICYLHSAYWIIADRHRNKEFPSFQRDIELQIDCYPLNDPSGYKFAFKSIDQLQGAFTPNELREAVNKLGFKVIMFTVNDYFVSPYQVIFRNPLTTEDITGLFS